MDSNALYIDFNRRFDLIVKGLNPTDRTGLDLWDDCLRRLAPTLSTPLLGPLPGAADKVHHVDRVLALLLQVEWYCLYHTPVDDPVPPETHAGYDPKDIGELPFVSRIAATELRWTRVGEAFLGARVDDYRQFARCLLVPSPSRDDAPSLEPIFLPQFDLALAQVRREAEPHLTTLRRELAACTPILLADADAIMAPRGHVASLDAARPPSEFLNDAGATLAQIREQLFAQDATLRERTEHLEEDLPQ